MAEEIHLASSEFSAVRTADPETQTSNMEPPMGAYYFHRDNNVAVEFLQRVESFRN